MSRVNWGELCGALSALEDRVAELESVTRAANPKLVTTVVDADEWKRLCRIEQLAARLLESPCPMGDAVRAANWQRLADAVGRR